MNTQLRDLIEGCVHRKGAHLIDLIVRGANAKVVFDVYVDTEKGVTTDLCSSISREIGEVLASSPALSRDYVLTVSSPGTDRSLRFPWQYAKHVGRTLKVKTKSGEQIGELTGICRAVDDAGVTIETKNGEVTVPHSAIQEAKVKTPW